MPCAVLSNGKKRDSKLTLCTVIMASVSMLSACGGSSSSSTNTPAQQGLSATTDSAIAAALYNDDRTPDGFYAETLPADKFYTTTHLRNTDLMPVAGRAAVAPWDLSSEDFAEIVDWSELAAFYQNPSRQLVDNRATRLYHELVRVDPNNPNLVQRHRVYRASMLNRDNIDDHYRGRITRTAFDAGDVRDIIEYQWSFTVDNNYGNAVLSSQTTDNGDAYLHRMLQARLIPVAGGCDTIELYQVDYEVPKATGNIWKNSTLLRSWSARFESGQASVCG